MNNIVLQDLKSFAIKAIIILMSILYILGPIHIEVNKLLHSIVHAI